MNLINFTKHGWEREEKLCNMWSKDIFEIFCLKFSLLSEAVCLMRKFNLD